MNRTRYFAAALTALVAPPQCISAPGAGWNLADVSFLFALPQGGPETTVELLGPHDRGAGDELLPLAIYERIPTLLNGGNGNQTLYRNALRVTSARVDPCPTLAADSCSPELRLVWQPVEFDAFQRKWTTRDAALHCVYAVPRNDFARLKRDLWEIKLKYARLGIDTTLQALGIHPALQNEKTAASFRRDARSIILAYAGGDNIRKITFSALLVPTQWWGFGGFERDPAGHWMATQIPRIEAQTVDVFNVAARDGRLGPDEGMDAVFNVLPDEYPEPDDILPLINKGFRFNDDRDLSVFREKLAAVTRFRNPHRSNTQELDCASCHYADAARYYAGNRFPQIAGVRSADDFENPDPATFNLANNTVTTASTRIVRAFGYFDHQPAISQRTINESAVSADWLNTFDQLVSAPRTSAVDSARTDAARRYGCSLSRTEKDPPGGTASIGRDTGLFESADRLHRRAAEQAETDEDHSPPDRDPDRCEHRSARHHRRGPGPGRRERHPRRLGHGELSADDHGRHHQRERRAAVGKRAPVLRRAGAGRSGLAAQNDIHLRDCPRDEPRNAHSHGLAMLLGNSEVVPVVSGELDLGRWQSVMLVELDGPRERTLSLSAWGEE